MYLKTKQPKLHTKAKKALHTKVKKPIRTPRVLSGSSLPKSQQKSFSSSATAGSIEFTNQSILTRVEDEILFVKFNQPKVLNAMNVDMGNEMVDIISKLQQDNGKTIKCVVFTGEGRAFSAGGDLAFLKARSEDSPQNNITEMLSFYKRFMGIRNIPVPTIAAINGPGIGAGAAVACLADVRVMSANASLGWTFSPLGLHPGMGSTFYLPKLTNPSTAAHLLYSGDIIDAGLAKQFGLVHEVVNTDTDDIEANNQATLRAATVLAKHYTKSYSPATFTLTKTLRAQMDVGLESALLREAEAQAITYNTPEFKTRLDNMINRKKSPKH